MIYIKWLINNKYKRANYKNTQIRIDKNNQFGKKQRFKPLEKLEEKHLQEDDSLDSLDLSMNYGPAKVEEANLSPIENMSSDEKPSQMEYPRSNSKKRYSDLDKGHGNAIYNDKIMTQRHSPKNVFKREIFNKRQHTPEVDENSQYKHKRGTIIAKDNQSFK